MNPVYLLHNLYEISPEWLRRSAGGVLGRIPPTLRYGSAFARSWQLLGDSETWSSDQIARYQLTQLCSLLEYAGSHVPYYRRLFTQLHFDPRDVKVIEDIQQLPILTRSMVRELGRDLLAENLPKRSYKYSSTAGSSGKPLGFYITYDASAAEWAFMLRNWSHAGFKSGDKRAVIRGRHIEGRETGRIWDYDPVNQAINFSSFDLNEDNFRKYVREMLSFKPDYLHAYPSSATLLAQYLEYTGEKIPSIRGLLLGSENIYPEQRTYLERVFGKRVFSWYGHSEKCVLAGECPAETGYHVFPEYGITELVDAGGQPVSMPGKRGQIVGTGFNNRATVLIRYLTDDEAEWMPYPCSCGWLSPRLANVCGRWHQEMLVGRSGALIPMAAVNLHTELYTRMRQFQFFQETPGVVILKIVKADLFTDQDEKGILTELYAKVKGEIDLSIEYLDSLPKTTAGKYNFIDQKIQLSYPDWEHQSRSN